MLQRPSAWVYFRPGKRGIGIPNCQDCRLFGGEILNDKHCLLEVQAPRGLTSATSSVEMGQLPNLFSTELGHYFATHSLDLIQTLA